MLKGNFALLMPKVALLKLMDCVLASQIRIYFHTYYSKWWLTLMYMPYTSGTLICRNVLGKAFGFLTSYHRVPLWFLFDLFEM